MPKLITALVVAALTGVASAPCALAQTSPSGLSLSVSTGGVSSYDIGQFGITVGVDPQKGIAAEVDAGEGAGISVGAGPDGPKLDLRQNAPTTSPAASIPSQPSGREPANTGQPAPGRDRAVSAPARPGARAPAAPVRSAPAVQPSATGTGEPGTSPAERSAGKDRAADRAGKLGVAPVLDFIEEIPRAVWAGLFALALIAIAMWTMWVRGRRRLERNAWVDAETGTMNLVAFETTLAQEWTRSGRYRRPLGLLLLELERDTSGDAARRPLGTRRMRQAWEAVTDRVREADTVAQLSASRLAVICPESSPGSVETLARALESTLEAEQVHARVGVGERFEDDRGPADLVARAAAGLEQSGVWAGVADSAPPGHSRAVHVAA